MSFEFDYSGSRCQAGAQQFKAREADLTDPGRTASIDYAEIVDPNSGRVLGPAFQLEVRTGTDEVWATYVGTGLAGTLDEVSITASDGGGQVLSATGVAVAFRNNGAMIGRKAPFRIEAACF